MMLLVIEVVGHEHTSRKTEITLEWEQYVMSHAAIPVGSQQSSKMYKIGQNGSDRAKCTLMKSSSMRQGSLEPSGSEEGGVIPVIIHFCL